MQIRDTKPPCFVAKIFYLYSISNSIPTDNCQKINELELLVPKEQQLLIVMFYNEGKFVEYKMTKVTGTFEHFLF